MAMCSRLVAMSALRLRKTTASRSRRRCAACGGAARAAGRGAPGYPERALREALANALIHRDYLRLAATYFQWYNHGPEISSLGGAEGVRPDNLLVTGARLCSPLLADAFSAPWVRAAARGE